ncbi:hypothetical protein [Actinomadura keratinilytica]|jgi:hypothetical protein
MKKLVHVPYTVEQDEDGGWAAHALLMPAWARTAKATPPTRR